MLNLANSFHQFISNTFDLYEILNINNLKEVHQIFWVFD